MSINASAQDWTGDVYKTGKIYPGYMIDAKGKKTEGFIKLQNRYAMQVTVLFYTDKDDRKSKQKIKAETLKEYSVAEKTWRCINYSGGMSKKSMRGNLLLEAGCISTYVWYSNDVSVTTKQEGETNEMYNARRYPSTTIYHKVGDEKAVTDAHFLLKFSKNMSEYVASNEELSAKVAAKEKGYRLIHIEAIMDEYNKDCEE